MHKLFIPMLGLLFLNIFMLASVNAVAIFFTNEADWLAQVNNLEAFDTTIPNMELSDELQNNPITVNNFTVGITLNWQSVNTGLSRSFRFTSVGAPFLTYNDNEVGPSTPPDPGFEDAISPGDINNGEDDDWQVEFLDGSPVTAFGAFIGNNLLNAGESFSVFDTNDQLIGSTTQDVLVSSGFQFLGVITDQAIGRVFFDEDAGGDDISVRNFRFANANIAVPEPATIIGLLLGFTLVIYRKH